MQSFKRKYKLVGFPTSTALDAMPFGRQVEWLQKIRAIKDSWKSTHLSQKRKTNASAIREFIALYRPKEYYCDFHDSALCRDDCFQIWYRV